MQDPIQSDITNGPERHAFQFTGRACSITSRTLFSTTDRAASLVRDEEMLAVREIRVRSSVKRDTDWTVNISLRWHGTRLGVSRLAREGLERWVYVFISRLRGSLSRDVWTYMWEQVVTSASSATELQLDQRRSCPIPRSCKMLYTRIRVKCRLCRREHRGILFSFANNANSQGPYEKSRRIHHRRRGKVLAFSPLFRVVPCFESDTALYYVFTRVFAREWKWNKCAW